MAKPAGWKVKVSERFGLELGEVGELALSDGDVGEEVVAAVVGDVALDVVQGVGVDVGLGVGGDERVGGAARAP